MNGNKRGGLFLGGVGIVCFFLSCSPGGDRCSRWVVKTLDKCKEELSLGNYSNAINECERVVYPEEDECVVRDVPLCQAHYLLFLSNVFYLLDSASSLISLLGNVGGLLPAPPEPALSPSSLQMKRGNLTIQDIIEYVKVLTEGKVPVDSFVVNLLQPMYLTMTHLQEHVDYVIANRCSVYVEKIPLTLFENFSISVPGLIELSGRMELRGEWDFVEANLFSAFIDLIKGIIDLILSYDLNLNPSGLLDLLVRMAEGEEMSTLEILRLAGGMVYGSDFLKWHNVRQNLFMRADDELASFFLKLANGLDELFKEQDNDPKNDIIYWYDRNGNGLYLTGDGDEVCVNLYKEGSDEKALEGVCGFIGTLISSEYIANAVSLMRETGGCLGETGSPDCRINLANAINTLTFELLPFKENLYFAPRRFFGDPKERKPLRDFLPFLYDPDSDGSLSPVFLIEAEVYPPQGTSFIRIPCTTTTCDYKDENGEKHRYPSPVTPSFPVFYQYVGDSVHFTTGFKWNETDKSIGADGRMERDCFSLTPELSSYTIFIFGMKDPSIGGALLVNPNEDPNEFPACTDMPDEILPPGNYHFNRVISYWQRKIYELLNLFQGGFGR